jgi:hypothetical protein
MVPMTPPVEILSATINDCSVKDGTIQYAIEFFDGQKKREKKSVELSDPSLVAVKSIMGIKAHVKQASLVDDSQLQEVLVKDEAKVIDDLSVFFTKAKTQLETIQNMTSPDNYMNMIDALKNLKVEFGS